MARDSSTHRQETKLGSDRHHLNQITERIIGCAFKVSNTLGVGFSEKVYENALIHEIHKCGLKAVQQHKIEAKYDAVVVGDIILDILVEDAVVLEIKAAKRLEYDLMVKSINYLKLTRYPLCLLINFGLPKIKIKRIMQR
jgi:GxxExxY protein